MRDTTKGHMCGSGAIGVAVCREDVPEPAKARSEVEDFDLTQIPYEAERRIGHVFREGERKYGKNNWRNGAGNKDFQLERANHALKHLKLYVHTLQFGEELGEPGEDDLAKVGWFVMTQCEIERLEKKNERP